MATNIYFQINNVYNKSCNIDGKVRSGQVKGEEGRGGRKGRRKGGEKGGAGGGEEEEEGGGCGVSKENKNPTLDVGN